MTARTWANLDALIGEFKQAAIDAFMRTLPNVHYEVVGDHYEGFMGNLTSGAEVTRPGSDGAGGGDWSQPGNIFAFMADEGNDRRFREAFDGIRSFIDAVVERWLDIPDPDGIEPEIEKCRQASRRLSGNASAGDTGQTGSGVIHGNLALIMENASAMSGASISAFKSRFVSQLGSCIGGHHGISILLGTVFAAEKGLWEAARQDVVDLVADARDASRHIADSGSTSPDMTSALNVVGWALKGAGMLFPAAKPVFEGAGLGITILQGTAPKVETVINGATAEAVLTDFEKALQKLADQIEVEERILDDNLAQNLANIRNDASSYDLTAPIIVDENAGDVILYTPALIDEIVDVYLPAISAELASIASSELSASMTVLSRDSSIGLGINGPSYRWYELRYLLYELLSNLRWDVDMAARNLDLVMQEMLGQESDFVQDLQDYEEQIAVGSPHDPWNIVDTRP